MEDGETVGERDESQRVWIERKATREHDEQEESFILYNWKQ
jgi:hypothetical protein